MNKGVTCYFSGRLGNIFFNIAMMVAYCKKYNLKYYIPELAEAYSSKKSALKIPSTCDEPKDPFIYKEPFMADGTPCYHDIPKMENVLFDGYFQTFRYFDWCRDHILKTFNIPYEMNKDVVSVSVRRGDCVGSTAFPIAPPEYYQKAIALMQVRGYNHFKVFSDDNEWCRNEFKSENYHGAEFEFSEKSELEDWIALSQCEHNITARSTFSLSGAWMNRNPNKIVLVPQENMWWRGQNRDLIPDYFTQVKFKQRDGSDKKKYEYDYAGFTFKLIINKYWSEICNGKPKEELYHDYKVMLDLVQRIEKERYILDIGANCGIFAVPTSILGYKVFGFEPVEDNVHSLDLAREANSLTRFDMFHAALSDRNGEVEIFIPECYDNASLSCEAAISNMIRKDYAVEKVPCFKFDDWIKDHMNFSNIGLIKMDVQGSEYSILAGMREYLAGAHNIYLICEYESHLNTMGHSYKELDALIDSYGFADCGFITGADKLWYKA